MLDFSWTKGPGPVCASPGPRAATERRVLNQGILEIETGTEA